MTVSTFRLKQSSIPYSQLRLIRYCTILIYCRQPAASCEWVQAEKEAKEMEAEKEEKEARKRSQITLQNVTES